MQTKTADGDSVASTLCKLGAVSCSGVNPVEVSKPLPQPVAPVFVDKSPVYLEVEHVDRIHEPDEGSPSVNIDLSEDRILLPTGQWPKPEPKWDGEWFGTEASRVAYLKQHRSLWAYCKPHQVRRRTACFFIRKKDDRLRKILACCNFNSVCRLPPACRLPGPWIMNRMRFRSKRIVVGEGDINAFYSRLIAAAWLKYFLCLSEIDAALLFNLQPGEFFECPYTGEVFYFGEPCVPCWPRVPMGWSWSVAIAVNLAEEIMREVLPNAVVSLNIAKQWHLRSSEIYAGAYIDNLFTFAEAERVSECARVQTLIENAFVERGLPLSQSDPPVSDKRIMGLETAVGPALTPPPGYAEECMYVATTTRVRYWIFEKAMGKNAWLFPLSRRFFSLLHRSYGLLAHHRRKETRSWQVIKLPSKVPFVKNFCISLGSQSC